jgi:hypothetical protein
MCEKCVEIDKKIDHYRWLAIYVNDERTAKGINELIQQYEAGKRALHPNARLTLVRTLRAQLP